MPIYAVGDIQGCYAPLRRLLDKVNFDPAHDRLWSVGDLVNRGPASLETLRFIKDLGPACTAVLGNHDLHLLALANDVGPGGKRETLQAILEAPDCEELCDWLRGLPLLHQERVASESGDKDFFMSHAGIAPVWSLQQARDLAHEVEEVLSGPHYRDFLRDMYGNQPDTWDSGLQGNARLRLILNYFTRMRFCNAAGKLDFSHKKGAETAPAGLRPWFEFRPARREAVLLFGHWAALQGETGREDVHALDTGCVWGRCLTLLRLHDRRRFTLPCA